MKVAKISNFSGVKKDDRKAIEQYRKDLDTDVENMILFTQGRVRFGSGLTGARGENLAGEFRSFTSSATPNAENTIPHTLGAIPVGFIVVNVNKGASIYAGTTAWTSTNIYLKCTVASTTVNVFLLK